MKIYNLQAYNLFRAKNKNNINMHQQAPKLQLQAPLTNDVVSFRAKNYSAESIKSPTNHCAYCGCKVYNEAQIEALAKEMLKDSSHRLQGDIKSVLEKLETAQRSEELTVEKQIENKEEIEFFKRFLEQAIDKSWLKGEAIFEQVWGLEQDKALQELKKNMRPLTKTIDHVSPQNLNEENKDDEINLVEACYCCNHDIKEGMSFAEFYRMYPSIKENMPVDKFKFAHAQLLASSSDTILLGVKASKLTKYISGLFAQRQKSLAQLNNVDFRIAESMPSIVHGIEVCRKEIAENEAEIAELKAKLESISDDSDYKAMLERQRLLAQQLQIETDLQSLRETRKNISDSKNELENPPKKGKKQKAKAKMSDDEKKQKIAYYRQQIIDFNQQIQQKELEGLQVQESLSLLDTQHPTPEILQARKNSYDAVISAYAQLLEEENKLSVLIGISSKLEFDIAQLENSINGISQKAFDATKYSQQEQEIYARYSELLETLKYIEQHSNSNGTRAVLLRCAKLEIEREMQEMAEIPIVVDATSYLKRKELTSKKDKATKEKEESDKNILNAQRKIEQLKKITAKCSLEEAKEQSVNITKWIRRLNDKQNYLQIPKTIEKLEAEILLLQRTADSLDAKKEEINSLGLTQF